MRRAIVPGLALVATALAQNSGLSPEVLFLSRMIRHVGESVTAVPNYTCTETLYREQLKPPGKTFQQLDLVKLEVAKVGHKEVFAWPGAGKFEETPIAEFLGGGGLIADGVFSLFAADLFVHGAGNLSYRGPEDFGGRKAVRIDYVVGSLRANFSLTTKEGSAVVSYSGSFWVDPVSLDLIRLVVNADGIPDRLRLSGVRITIDYRGDNAVPESAVLEMRKTTGEVSRDQIRFTNCRKFAGDATIVFDPAETPAAADDAPKIKTIVLPGNLTIALRLQTPIEAGKSSVGDEITAVVESDVKGDRRVWLTKGSIAHGRIRRLERHKGTPDYVLAGLEFSTVEAGLTHYEFVARLLSKAEIDLPMVGVGYLYLNTPPFGLPAGFPMIWRTQELRESDRSPK